MKSLTILALSLVMTGCATIINDKQQAILVETVTEDGRTVAGAKCSFYIDDDIPLVFSKSGETVYVERSRKNLEINCWRQGYPNAAGFAISRANIEMAGNLIIGGLIGAIVDSSTNAGFSYPECVKLVFGQTIRVDPWSPAKTTPEKIKNLSPP